MISIVVGASLGHQKRELLTAWRSCFLFRHYSTGSVFGFSSRLRCLERQRSSNQGQRKGSSGGRCLCHCHRERASVCEFLFIVISIFSFPQLTDDDCSIKAHRTIHRTVPAASVANRKYLCRAEGKGMMTRPKTDGVGRSPPVSQQLQASPPKKKRRANIHANEEPIRVVA